MAILLWVILICFSITLLWNELHRWLNQKSYKRIKRTYTAQQRFEYSKRVDKIHFVVTDESDCCSLNDEKAIRSCKNKYCMGKLINKIHYYIDSAKSLICIAMFTLNNYQLAESLIDAHRRGVGVRIILDRSMSKSENSQYKRLKAAGKFCRKFC